MKVEPSQITLVAPVIAAVTPAVAQIVIFAATLFFALVGQVDARRHLTSIFASRDAKLRFLRIANDIEHNLASYVAVVTAINVTLGAVVAAGAWLFGLRQPADARAADRDPQLHPVYRPGLHGRHPVRGRPRDVPDAGLRAAAAGGVRRR